MHDVMVAEGPGTSNLLFRTINVEQLHSFFLKIPAAVYEMAECMPF